MEPISVIIASAVGYILKGAASSKTATKAKEELTEGFWAWIRPYLIKDVPDLEDPATTAQPEQKVYNQLVQLIEQDENFFEKLVKRVAALKKAGIKEKNIVGKDIKRVKKIKIGDKAYATTALYNRKNIVEGSIEDGEEFILGDGH